MGVYFGVICSWYEVGIAMLRTQWRKSDFASHLIRGTMLIVRAGFFNKSTD
jgi:hypothetical protein